MRCKDCDWYDPELDETEALLDDDLLDEEEGADFHFCACFMYPEHIDPEIWDGKKKCEYFEDDLD